MEEKKIPIKDYERPSKNCPFKVKNIEECDAKGFTIKRIEEDGPFKGEICKYEINCYCKFPLYHFLKDLVDSILKDD